MVKGYIFVLNIIVKTHYLIRVNKDRLMMKGSVNIGYYRICSISFKEIYKTIQGILFGYGTYV